MTASRWVRKTPLYFGMEVFFGGGARRLVRVGCLMRRVSFLDAGR